MNYIVIYIYTFFFRVHWLYCVHFVCFFMTGYLPNISVDVHCLSRKHFHPQAARDKSSIILSFVIIQLYVINFLLLSTQFDNHLFVLNIKFSPHSKAPFFIISLHNYSHAHSRNANKASWWEFKRCSFMLKLIW